MIQSQLLACDSIAKCLFLGAAANQSGAFPLTGNAGCFGGTGDRDKMAKLLKHFGIGVKKTGSSSHRGGSGGAEYNGQKSNSVHELLPKSPTRYRSSQSLSTASHEYDTHSLKLYSGGPAAQANDANHHQRSSCTMNGRHEHRGPVSGGSSRSKEQKSLGAKANSSIDGTLPEERDVFDPSPDAALAAESPPQTATPPKLLDEYCDPLDLKKTVSDGTELLGAIAPTPSLDDDYSVPYEVKKILKGVRPRERGTGLSVNGQPTNGSMDQSSEVNGCLMEDSFDEPWEWITKLSALVAQNPSVYTPGSSSLTPMMTPKKSQCTPGLQTDKATDGGGTLVNGDDRFSVTASLTSPGSSEDDQENDHLHLEPEYRKDLVNETKTIINHRTSVSPEHVKSHSEKLIEGAGKDLSSYIGKSDIVTPDRTQDGLSGGLMIITEVPPDVDPCDCHIVLSQITDSDSSLTCCKPSESASVMLTQMNETENPAESNRNFQNFAKEKSDRADLAKTRSWNSASESIASSTPRKCSYNKQNQCYHSDSGNVKSSKLSSSKSGGNMSSKSNYVTTSSHCIAKEKINPDIVLEQQCWYHGSLGRIEAEELLQPEKDGSFLVRMSESSRLDYSLSLKSGRGFLHMKIVNLDGKFILGQFSQPFDSIPHMIEFYCMSKLPIKGNENISLIHPLANECSL